MASERRIILRSAKAKMVEQQLVTTEDESTEPTLSRRPSFFKFMLLDFTERLRIPPAFIQRFGGKIPTELILRNPTGKVWHVQVEKIGDGLFFKSGWPEFVEENLLQLGEVLVFSYQSNSEFDVKLFGRSGCEKEGASVELNEDGSSSYEEEENEQSNLEEKEEEESKEKEIPFKRFDQCSCSLYAGKPKVQQGDCPFKLKRLHFSTVLKPYKFHNMPVPAAFVDRSGLRRKQSVYVRDLGGQRWKVAVNHYPQRVLLGAGWSALVRANRFRKGAICGIECVSIRGRQAVKELQVHILHGVQ